MALDTFVAGAYSSTWNGTATGLTEDGYKLDQNIEQEEIRGDYYGQSIIEAVTLGANVAIDFTCLAFKAGSYAPFYPFATLGEMGTPGLLMTDIAKQLVLAVTTGTPAASALGASLTGSKSAIAQGHNSQIAFQSRLRRLPLRLRLFPYVSGVTRWYSLG